MPRPARPALALLVLLTGCLQERPVPDAGACAVTPDGAYTWGEIGIGTCLAGPADLAWSQQGDVLLVSNANPWGDFTGGSLLALDMTRLDVDRPENDVADLALGALDLPSFTGAMAAVGDGGTFAVTNRWSDGARTREEQDPLFFVDASDPAAMALDTVLGGPSGGIDAGYDPVAVLAEPLTGDLFVIQRTEHEVAMVDTDVSPAELVPPGGPGRLLPRAFEDVDGSGSRAAFSKLEAADATSLVGHDWTLSWNVATVHAWVPVLDGVRRLRSGGEGDWAEAADGREIDLRGNSLVTEIVDPWMDTVTTQDGSFARMVFVNQGFLWGAQSTTGSFWGLEPSALLGPDDDEGEAVLGGPAYTVLDEVWYLWYDAGDGVEQSIHLALSADGTSFDRQGPQIVPPAGSSYEDPFLILDPQADRWRMFFGVHDADGWSVGQAVSDDLSSWTELPGRFAPAGGAAAPVVGYWGGRFHMLYASDTLDGQEREAVSVDGVHWQVVGPAFAVDRLGGSRRPRVALQVLPEDNFSLVDESGAVADTPLIPGNILGNTTNGWAASVAVGQDVDPDDIGLDAEGGVQLDAVSEAAEDGTREGWFTVTDADGVGRVVAGTLGADGRWSLSPEVVAEAPFGPADESVTDPVVVETDAGRVMFYAAWSGGLPVIARAVEGAGGQWEPEGDALFVPELDFEAFGVMPETASLRGDVVRLYYTADDGERLRIGALDVAAGGLGAATRVPGADADWVFAGGAPGEWDDSGVKDAWVVVEGGTEHLWFAGSSGEAWRVGYASRPLDDAEPFEPSTDTEGTPRATLSPATSSFGSVGVQRPVTWRTAEDAWDLWYTGLDVDGTRVGRAVLTDPDRAWRDLRLPTLSDTWGFTAVPEDEGDAISLDLEAEGAPFTGLGCVSLSADPARGFVYVACEHVPVLYVLDVRDDSDGSFQDLNYLDVEAVVTLDTTSSGSVYNGTGFRQTFLDPSRDWLWGVFNAPSSLAAVDLDRIVDDELVDVVNDAVLAYLPLPNLRDAGVSNYSTVGAAQAAQSPDGRYVFVTNFLDNSVSCYDFAVGTPATLVAQADDVGENPFSIELSPDGRYAVVANYSGEVSDDKVNSTLTILDTDPTSASFMQVLTRVVNR